MASVDDTTCATTWRASATTFNLPNSGKKASADGSSLSSELTDDVVDDSEDDDDDD